MKSLLLGFAASAALVGAGSAQAADLGSKPAPLYAAPVMTPPFCMWCGFYVGGTIGGAWGDFRNTYTAPGPPAPPGFLAADAAVISANGSNELKSAGVSGGVEAGYNYQFNNVVVGVETDFEFLDLRKNTGGTFTTPAAGPQISSTSVSAPWLFTLRPRLGIAYGQALVYATGGLAVGEEKLSESNAFPAVNTGVDALSASRARVGWTAGGGIEYRVNARWSIKGEYLFVDLGSFNAVSASNTPFAGLTTAIFYNNNLRTTEQITRFGVNYRF